MGVHLYRRKNSKGKPTGPYWATISYRKRMVDGSLVLDRKHETMRTENRGEAGALADQRLKALEAAIHGANGAVTINAACDMFVEHKRHKLKERSIERYETSIVHIKRHLGSKALAEITGRALGEFLAARRKEVVPNSGKRSGERVTDSTILKDFSCLSSMFALMLKLEYATLNPVPGFLGTGKDRELEQGEARTVYFSEDQEATLLNAITARFGNRPTDGGDTYRKLYLAVVITIETGLRPVELYGIRREAVDLAGGINGAGVTVAKALAKSDRTRWVPLSARAIAAIRDLDGMRPFDCSWLLWHGADGQRYTPTGMDGPFAQVIEDCGWYTHSAIRGADGRRRIVRDFEFYDLRKTAGCRWLQRDRMPMAAVSQNLGHSSITTTEKHYAFLKRSDRRAEMDRADAARVQPSGTNADDKQSDAA